MLTVTRLNVKCVPMVTLVHVQLAGTIFSWLPGSVKIANLLISLIPFVLLVLLMREFLNAHLAGTSFILTVPLAVFIVTLTPLPMV